MLANRIETVLDTIINQDQQGFVKNRSLAGNVRKIFDLMKIAKDDRIDGFVLSLDFMKCFDYIEHTAITGAMNYFKFPEYMVNWVKIIYSKCFAKVQNNGHLSNRFEVQKGVRQGGPASSLLFLLCAEVLAIELRSNQEIKGILVAEILNLLGQFADDMDIYSLYDQKWLDHIFNILEKFKDSAGFTVNYDKTQIYRLGSLVGTKSELITARQITWTDGPLSILGICILHDEEQTILMNYNPIVTKIQSILKAWSCRSLSLYGKVIIINSLVASLFVHKMTVLPTIPAAIVKQIEFDLEKFLWNGRKAKIPLKTLQAAKSSGGLQLVDLTKKDKAVKVSWIRQLFVNPQLANLAYHIISNELKEDIWRFYLKAEDIGYMCFSTRQHRILERYV